MISVCMATCNGSLFIEKQIQSILSQLSDFDELIIFDDASEDNTVDIVKSFSDSRIKLFCNSQRVGVTENFNRSLSKANGDFIFLSDQDDVWLKDRVSSSLRLLETHDLVVSNCRVMDQNGRIIAESYFDIIGSRAGLLRNMYKCNYLGCALSFRRVVLKAILPIPSNLLMYHDWWIGITAELKFNTYFDSTPRFCYRRHDNTTSSTLGKSNRSLLLKLYSRIQLYSLVLTRYFKR